MGRERHRLSENRIGILTDEPQWCWSISKDTRDLLRRPGTVHFAFQIYCCCVNTQTGRFVADSCIVNFSKPHAALTLCLRSNNQTVR